MMNVLRACFVALALLWGVPALAQPSQGPLGNASGSIALSLNGQSLTLANWLQAFSYSGGNLTEAFGPYAAPYATLGVSSQVNGNNAAVDLVAQYGSNAGGTGYLDNVLTIQNNSISWRYYQIACAITMGSAVVTGCPTLTGISVGNVIGGGGNFPSGTTIAGGITSTGFTASQPAGSNGGLLSIEGQCGNAALRFRGPITGLTTQLIERGAFGYSVPGDACQGFFPNTVYTEAGNVSGVVGDPNDTSIAWILTHSSAATHFPGTSYRAVLLNGATGDIGFYNRTTGVMLYMTEATGNIDIPGSLSVDTSAAPLSGLDVGSKGIAVGSYAGVTAAPSNSAIISGQLIVGAATGPAQNNQIVGVGINSGHFDCLGAYTAAYGFVLTVECNTATSGIRYTETGKGAVSLSYNDIVSSATLNTDGSAITLYTGNITPGAGTAVAALSSTSAVFPGTTKATGDILTSAAPTVSSGQVGLGGTTAAASNCGGSATACLVINVAGTARYVPYF